MSPATQGLLAPLARSKRILQALWASRAVRTFRAALAVTAEQAVRAVWALQVLRTAWALRVLRTARAARALLLAIVVAAIVATGATAGGAAQAVEGCTKADFANAVDETGRTLRELNAKNAALFRARLRALKKARGWSDKLFLKKARPFVEGEQISAYDEQAAELLDKINSLGDGGNTGEGTPDCRLLAELKGHLGALVETIEAKWRYMFARLDKAMAEAGGQSGSKDEAGRD